MKHLVVILLLLAAPVWAVEPGEILDDPALEARARDLSEGLRCPVCRNESIDESNATLAKELRVVLRERLVAGDSDQDVLAYMVARYGEFILFKPDTSGANIILWLAAPLMFLMALGIGYASIRQRARITQKPLSSEEAEALEKILRS